MKNMFFRVEVACDTPEADQYVDWLNANGHRAFVGNSTATIVSDPIDEEGYSMDSEWDGDDDSVGSHLWAEYCQEG